MTIEEGAVVEESVIMPNTVVRRGAIIKRAIVAENCEIGPGALVGATEAESGEIALVGQNTHVPAEYVITAGEQIEQPFQVAGDQDVHRRGNRVVEGTVPVVLAGGDEIGEDVVAVGRAEQATDGQTHLLCVEGGQDVAEVARGDGKVYALAHLYLPAAHQIEVGREIVGYLRRKPAEVYGVGGREYDVLFFQSLSILFA